MNEALLKARMTYKQLLVTSSGAIADPSGGKASEFRVTMVGGGGGGVLGASYRAGGGGEGYSFKIYKGIAVWPVAVTIGAGGAGDAAPSAGGSTKFGSEVVAGGEAKWQACGGGTNSTKNVALPMRNASVGIEMGGRSNGSTSSGLLSASVVHGVDTVWSSGGGGGANASNNGSPCAGFGGGRADASGGGGGASLLGAGGDAAAYAGKVGPGPGGGGGGGKASADNGGTGAVLLEWWE